MRKSISRLAALLVSIAVNAALAGVFAHDSSLLRIHPSVAQAQGVEHGTSLG